jgi:hypothetical protein
MTVAELEKRQADLMPKDDLTPYEGQWVALRDGHVVASDLSAVALRDKSGVEGTDMIMRVPSKTRGTFVL